VRACDALRVVRSVGLSVPIEECVGAP